MDNSNSLFRDMIQTTLDHDLNKTELQVFLVLLMQTLGFGKASDPLTYGRIAHTMHKRKDHVKAAMKNLLNAELFDAIKHPRFEYRYRIGTKFLQKHRGDFFTPTLPKTGEGLRKMEKFSENWEHTVLYPYSSLPLQQQTTATEQNCTKSNQFNPTPSCCCCQNIKSQEPSTAVATAPPVPQANADAPVEREHLTRPANAENNAIPKHTASAQAEHDNAEPSQAAKTYHQAQATVEHDNAEPTQAAKTHHQTQTTNEKEPFDWSGVKLPTLPDSIRPENHAFIYGLFKQGNLQQAENALIAYDNMQKTRFVHSPTGLLRRLTERAHNNRLGLPDVVEVASPENNPQQKPLHPSHQPYDPNPLAHLSPEEQKQRKRNEDIAYLMDVSKRNNKSLTDMAKTMRMEHVLPYMQPQIEAQNTEAKNKDLSANTAVKKQATMQKTTYKGSLASLLDSLMSEHLSGV